MSCMKFSSKSRVVRLLSSGILLLFAYPAMSAIQGSVHDFTSYTWSGGQICGVCHSPHGGASGIQAPLWGHDISSATYTLYTSPSMYDTADQPQPGGNSRLCLSCHDGTVAIDSFGGTVGSTYIDAINPRAKIGTDLSNDHPVGVRWLHQIKEQQDDCVQCHNIMNNMEIKFVRFYADYSHANNGGLQNRIECGTCHDVHNDVPNPKLLRRTMAGSELCQQCHGK